MRTSIRISALIGNLLFIKYLNEFAKRIKIDKSVTNEFGEEEEKEVHPIEIDIATNKLDEFKKFLIEEFTKSDIYIIDRTIPGVTLSEREIFDNLPAQSKLFVIIEAFNNESEIANLTSVLTVSSGNKLSTTYTIDKLTLSDFFLQITRVLEEINNSLMIFNDKEFMEIVRMVNNFIDELNKKDLGRTLYLEEVESDEIYTTAEEILQSVEKQTSKESNLEEEKGSKDSLRNLIIETIGTIEKEREKNKIEKQEEIDQKVSGKEEIKEKEEETEKLSRKRQKEKEKVFIPTPSVPDNIPLSTKKTTLIFVSSPKGGVGLTKTLIEISKELSIEKKILLVDMNFLHLGDALFYLNISEPKTLKKITEMFYILTPYKDERDVWRSESFDLIIYDMGPWILRDKPLLLFTGNNENARKMAEKYREVKDITIVESKEELLNAILKISENSTRAS